MQKHLSLNRILVVVMALSLMIFAVGASAQEDDSAVPTFDDGRVNNLDIAAPVAIYQYYSYPYSEDVNFGVLDDIQFWGITGSGSIEKVLDVSRTDILNTTVTSGSSALLASNQGYSVYKEANGSLTVIAPSDAAGSDYQFNWMPGL